MTDAPEIVCLNVGAKYGHEYELRLYEGLCRHTTIPWDFRVIRQSRAPGWWAKLMLFPPSRRTLFLDLDVVVVRNVDALLTYDGPFCIWGDPWNGRWNSSVMSIAPGFGAEVSRTFLDNPRAVMAAHPGDQDVIWGVLEDADLWQTVAPGLVQSYKADALQDGPGDAGLCVFHGDPKPHTFREGWVHDAWHGTGQWAGVACGGRAL